MFIEQTSKKLEEFTCKDEDEGLKLLDEQAEAFAKLKKPYLSRFQAKSEVTQDHKMNDFLLKLKLGKMQKKGKDA